PKNPSWASHDSHGPHVSLYLAQGLHATLERSFFRSRALSSFSIEQLRVILRPIAIKIVTDEVDAEMEAAKDIFGMSSKDITPELLLSFDLDPLLTARL
ncbi:hypothetical protein BDR04DRAFT_1097231, partial [Suillus decipiens]